MPFALIPDGFSLVKVTKAQEKAVKDKRRHDDVVAFLSNPNTPLTVAGAGLVALTPFLFNLVEKALEEQNIILSDDQKKEIKTAVANPLFFATAKSVEAGFEKGVDIGVSIRKFLGVEE